MLTLFSLLFSTFGFMIKFSDSFALNLSRAFKVLLCEERKKRKLSQFELAQKSGLTRQSVSLFESGTRAPTFFSMFRLANGFGMPVAKLVVLLMKRFEDYENSEEILMVADSQRPKWKV